MEDAKKAWVLQLPQWQGRNPGRRKGVIPCAGGLQDPNPEDPLNKEAAEMQQSNVRSFEAQVQAAIRHGAFIGGNYFPPCRA